MFAYGFASKTQTTLFCCNGTVNTPRKLLPGRPNTCQCFQVEQKEAGRVQSSLFVLRLHGIFDLVYDIGRLVVVLLMIVVCILFFFFKESQVRAALPVCSTTV